MSKCLHSLNFGNWQSNWTCTYHPLRLCVKPRYVDWLRYVTLGCAKAWPSSRPATTAHLMSHQPTFQSPLQLGFCSQSCSHAHSASTSHQGHMLISNPTRISGYYVKYGAAGEPSPYRLGDSGPQSAPLASNRHTSWLKLGFREREPTDRGSHYELDSILSYSSSWLRLNAVWQMSYLPDWAVYRGDNLSLLESFILVSSNVSALVSDGLLQNAPRLRSVDLLLEIDPAFSNIVPFSYELHRLSGRVKQFLVLASYMCYKHNASDTGTVCLICLLYANSDEICKTNCPSRNSGTNLLWCDISTEKGKYNIARYLSFVLLNKWMEIQPLRRKGGGGCIGWQPEQ
jgi:hypothetical protein